MVISDYSMLKEAFVTKGIELAGRPDSYMTLYYNPDYPHKKGTTLAVTEALMKLMSKQINFRYMYLINIEGKIIYI